MKALKIASIIFLCINIIALIFFTGLVLSLRNFYYKDAERVSLIEELLKERPDANAIRFFLSTPYIFIFTVVILIAKEWLKNKKLTLIINIVSFIILCLVTPVVLAWFVHLAPILQLPT